MGYKYVFQERKYFPSYNRLQINGLKFGGGNFFYLYWTRLDKICFEVGFMVPTFAETKLNHYEEI